jgi:hypothetical protein
MVALQLPDGDSARQCGKIRKVAMSQIHRLIELADYELDAAPIVIPPGGISLKACSFRNLDMAGIVISVFIARGCSFDSCNFTGTRFGAAYFGGGTRSRLSWPLPPSLEESPTK